MSSGCECLVSKECDSCDKRDNNLYLLWSYSYSCVTKWVKVSWDEMRWDEMRQNANVRQVEALISSGKERK